MRKRTLALLSGLLAALSLTACSVQGADVVPEKPSLPSHLPVVLATPEPTPEPELEVLAGVNPLTGLPIDPAHQNRRPIAIMLNNLKRALPQLGQSQCDIIYECLAEGGITRMLGIYQSVEGVGIIGSVRSSRPYYLELALGLDAVYLHAGGSPDAYAKIKSWGVTALDCVNGPYEGSSPGANLFWRDRDRRVNNGLEHSVVTTGENIVEKFAGYSFRQEHEAGYQYLMVFSDDGTPQTGETAEQVCVPFSQYKTGVFTYDGHADRYLVEEYGKPYVDGNSGEQVAVTNVLVLKTAVAPIPGDSYGRVSVDLSGRGEGFFACGGKIIPIYWSKQAPSGQLLYTDAAGTPLVLGRGNSYVNIIPLSADITYQ